MAVRQRKLCGVQRNLDVLRISGKSGRRNFVRCVASLDFSTRLRAIPRKLFTPRHGEWEKPSGIAGLTMRAAGWMPQRGSPWHTAGFLSSTYLLRGISPCFQVADDT